MAIGVDTSIESAEASGDIGTFIEGCVRLMTVANYARSTIENLQLASIVTCTQQKGQRTDIYLVLDKPDRPLRRTDEANTYLS